MSSVCVDGSGSIQEWGEGGRGCFFCFFNHRMQNAFSLFSPFLFFSSILLSNGARLRISAAVALKVVSVLSPAAPETSSDARQSSHAALPAASRTHACVCVCVCNIRLLRHLRTRRALQMGCESQFVSGGVIRLLEGSRWSEDLEAVLTEPGSVPPAAPFCFSVTG